MEDREMTTEELKEENKIIRAALNQDLSEKVSMRMIGAHYGYEAQRIKCMEELGELIVALAKNDRDSITEEVADCEIMLFQIKHLLKLHILNTKRKKIERQLERIKREQKGK